MSAISPCCSQDGSLAEDAVIQLARLYMLVHKVPMSKPGLPAPYEHTGNSVAYPLESHALLQRLAARAEDLPKYLTILFEGKDRSTVSKSDVLKVRTVVLRSRFAWLLFNCWLWMEATRSLPITSAYFGEDIEAAIASFHAGDNHEAGVPESLVAAAVPVGSAEGIHCAQGPADAVASDSDGDDSGIPSSGPDPKGRPSFGDKKATAKSDIPFHAAVLDTSTRDMSILQEWNHVLKNCDIMGSIDRSIQGIRACDMSEEDKQKALSQQEAVGEAAVALSRLSRNDVRAALAAWESQSEGASPQSEGTVSVR